jgi:hypothetical protein
VTSAKTSTDVRVGATLAAIGMPLRMPVRRIA